MAYETNLLPAIRQEVGKRLGVCMVIPNGNFDAVATGSITSASYLRDTNYGTGHFAELYTNIFRPGAASAADYIRPAGDLTNTTGLLAHTGANYADTTIGTEGVELWFHRIRPDIDIPDCINRVLRETSIRTIHALSHGSSAGDYSMDLSTDSLWTNVGSPSTSAKTAALPAFIPYGPYAYNVANNGVANEGTRSAELVVRQGATVSAYAIAAASTGTASFQLRDNTNSADIGTAVTHSERAAQLMVIRNQAVPDTCKSVRLSMLGTTTTSDIYWNKTWLYKHDELFIRFPSYISERFKAATIFQSVPQFSTAANVYDALGMDMVELKEGSDYFLHFNHGDANPYGVRFASNTWFDNPLWTELERPASDYTTFATDETASTVAPFNKLVPAVCLDFIDRVMTPRGIMLDKLPALRARAQKDYNEAQENRPAVSVAKANPYFRGVGPRV